MRKNRGWKSAGGEEEEEEDEHVFVLQGDACYPNVMNGRDQPHVPTNSMKAAQLVHFTFMTE